MKLKKADRKKQLLAAALTLYENGGAEAATLSGVARAAGVSQALVTKHFKTREEMLNQILRAAIKTERRKAVLIGYLTGHPVAVKAPAYVLEAARHAVF